jgi:LysR family transcriptional regulator, pca operon transcriptional activator
MIMHPAIKLRHIRAFLDIAASGNLTAVARAQGISQPALSRSLAELEDLLSVSLFTREARRLVLTEAGRMFRHHASLGVQALEAAASALRPGTGGKMTVGVLPTAATRLFPQVALRWQPVMPDRVLSVITGPQSHLMDLLRAAEIDLMIGRMPAAAQMAGLTFEHLYEDEVVLVVRREHPMRGLSAGEILRRCPLILPPEGAIIRRAVDDYLASLGLIGPRAAMETVALSIGRGVVMGSDAVWFISKGVIRDELDRGEAVIVSTNAGYLSGAVGITRRQDHAPNHGLDTLIQMTRDAVRSGAHL